MCTERCTGRRTKSAAGGGFSVLSRAGESSGPVALPIYHIFTQRLNFPALGTIWWGGVCVYRTLYRAQNQIAAGGFSVLPVAIVRAGKSSVAHVRGID